MRAFTTTATPAGDHYVVTGTKRWIKLGGVSDLMTLMVVDSQGGLSRLVLERDVSPWQSRELEAVGIKNVSFAELTFDHVRVPRENLLGAAGVAPPCDVSMAKLFAVETAIGTCQTAMESMGAWGLAEDAGVERCWRDCAMLAAIDGTANVQRLIIGRELLGVAAFV